MLTKEQIDAVILRLQDLRLDGQLTVDQQAMLDGVIEELRILTAQVEPERESAATEKTMATLRRVAWWLLVRVLSTLDDNDSQI